MLALFSTLLLAHADSLNYLLLVIGDSLNLIEGFLTNGLQTVRVFDPTNQTYRVVGEMERGRWYPTVNVLADGNLLIVGGMQQASTFV